MPWKAKRSTITGQATTGTQSFPFGSGWGTPDCAIVVGSWNASAYDTPTVHAGFTLGWTDGTNEWCVNLTSENDKTPVDSYARCHSDQVYCALTANVGNIRDEANFSSFSADTVTINWSNAPNNSPLLSCIAFDLPEGATVTVGNFTMSTSINGEVNVTAHGVEADVVFLSTAWGTALDTKINTSSIGIGFWCKDPDGNTSQMGTEWEDADATSPGNPHGLTNQDYALQNRNGTSRGVGCEISAHASGFTATTRDLGGGAAYIVGYMAITFPPGTYNAHVAHHSVRNSTGTFSTTGTGFKPSILFNIASNIDARDTVQVDASAEAMGFGFASGTAAADQICHSCHVEDATGGNSNTHNLVSQNLHAAGNGTTPSIQTGNLDSFDDDGFTMDWTAAPITLSGFAVYLALEAKDPISAVTKPPQSTHLRM